MALAEGKGAKTLKGTSEMKKSYMISAIAAVIFLVAILTNPNQERHKEAVKTKLNASIQKAMKEMSTTEEDKRFEQIAQGLTRVFGGPLVDAIVGSTISSDNYIFFSTTRFSDAGETKIIGIGVFGNVFLSKKINDALK